MRSSRPAERSQPGIRLVRGPDGRLLVEPRKPITKPQRGEFSFTIPWPNVSVFLQQFRSAVRKLPISHLKRHTLRYGIVGASLAIVAVVLVVITHRPPTVATVTGVKGANTAAGLVRGTPSYATVLPNGRTAESLGGWYRVSPPNSDPVYAFADRIGSVELDVSEQPLPESFKQNTAEQVAQLAQSFGANEKIVASDTTFYVGTSAKGPQSIILTKNGLLILIKSSDKLSTNAWVAYITSLK